MKKMVSPALTATLRALHGESDLQIVAPALDDLWFTRVLALAPGVDPIIGALGALAGEVPDVLPPAVRDSPILSVAIASLIGTDTGKRVLPTWAEVVPAGWGASLAAALIDAVRRNRCAPWTAAALIGPTDASAALLHIAWDIAIAIRRWGKAMTDDPTAWMNELAPTGRDRLLDVLRCNPKDVAICLPWLPAEYVTETSMSLLDGWIGSALDACAEASPIAHARHANVLAALIRSAGRDHLVALTRLAVASRMNSAWERIVHLLREAPNHAIQVVAAAPWDALHPDVQETILSAASHNAVSAAIVYACGMRPNPPAITWKTARAFFAAVTPGVWDALPKRTQQAWHSSLDKTDLHRAVRSLGPDPMFLACAALNADLIAAVRCHTPNEESTRWTLLPVAMHDLPVAAVPDIVDALPPPPDPVAFVQIASESPKIPLALHDWIMAHPTQQARGTAITVLHATAKRSAPIERCGALAHALEGWRWKETNALLAALLDDTRAAQHPHPDILTEYLEHPDQLLPHPDILTERLAHPDQLLPHPDILTERLAHPDQLLPHPDILTERLAHPDQHDTFRQALNALAALPPSVAIPTLHALDTLGEMPDPDQHRQAGEEVARALRDHGDYFTAIVGTLRPDMRAALLPHLDDPHVGSTLVSIAAADPLVAHHLAHALRPRSLNVVFDTLTEAPFERMCRIWRLLPEPLQHIVLGERDVLLRDVAAPGCADVLEQTLRAWRDDDDPLPWLALCLLIDADPDRRIRGMMLLAQQPDMTAAILSLLRNDLQTTLASVPAIGFASADQPPLPAPAPTPMPVIARRQRRSR